ncbi:MAG: hypothetical protein VCC00_15205 [Deltaproteobacteria bacterium]
MRFRGQARRGQWVALLAFGLGLAGCENRSAEGDGRDQLTPYQLAAITLCNDGAPRVLGFHKLAGRAKSRKLYEALAAPIVAETIRSQRATNRTAAFGDFLAEFTAAEATFVWENRRVSATALDRKHLDWCRRQDDWISSYR